jgi:methionyl-tRNA synthetase
MSKSLGNVVDPHKMAAEYGVDGFRYFLLREVPFGTDGDFSEKSLLNRFNSELANNLGNLLQRTVTLITKNFAGVIPSANNKTSLLDDLPKRMAALDAQFEALAFAGVLENILELLSLTNKYIDEKAPWKMGLDQKEELAQVLLDCLSVLKVACVVLAPFMPGKMQDLWASIGEAGRVEEEGKKLLADFRAGHPPQFLPGQIVIKGDPLFMRKGGRWK